MDSAPPDPAARLLTVVEAVAARAEEANRRLDELTARLDELGGAPPAPAPPDRADPARLAAIELAIAGTGRAQTARQLRERFPDAELEPILEDVFGAD
jgi:hypothetical protein